MASTLQKGRGKVIDMLLAALPSLPLCSLFEDILRKQGESPNKLLESLHLQRYTDEGARQAAEATDALFESRRGQKQKELDFRASLQDKLNKSRGSKAAQLQHDSAVHAALLRRKVRAGRAGGRVQQQQG
jgi:hypothetical protein